MGDRIGVQLPVREIYPGLTNHTGQLNLAIPPRVDAMSTSQMAVMLYGLRVKADMVLVRWQVNCVIPFKIRAISDHLEAKLLRLHYITLNIF